MGVGMAFAIWHIDVVQYTDSRSLSVMKDDIFENYDIKKVGDDDSNQIKTYTIYLYPSTLYLNDYLDYLNGETEVLPEEKYGYIEPSVGIDGNISYHVHSVGGDHQLVRLIPDDRRLRPVQKHFAGRCQKERDGQAGHARLAHHPLRACRHRHADRAG